MLRDLNPEQKKAVTATEGPVLVLAGAGSGKTRVLTYRIAYLIKEMGIPPWEILAVTFTKKAAREMSERVDKLIGQDRGSWIGTFHSTFAKILRWEAAAYNYSSNFVIYDSDDQLRLIKMIMEANEIPLNLYNPNVIQSVISKSKNALVSPETFQKQTDNLFDQAVARIYPEYQNRLRENLAFDFDDLITVPIYIFRKYPEILEKYQNRFQYILVDEYQDTNRAQYELVRQLSGKTRNLCVVGDDDQSIYGWRGADINNILDFETDFPETQVFRLEQNYRSTKNILTAAHSIVSKNPGRKPKKLWSENPEGEKVELWQVENDREEAYKVVDKIQYEVLKHKRAFHDFAILYRTNAQSRALEDGLRRSGMSYVIVGGVRFYDRKEVKDVLAYIKLIVNPRDTVSLKRVINFPTRGIGETSLKRIESWSIEHDLGLFETLSHVDEIDGLTTRAKNAARQFYELIAKYHTLINKISPVELVHTLVDDSNVLAFYKDDVSIEAQNRVDNIRELLSAVGDYAEETDEPTLNGFLEEVSLVNDLDQWNDKCNAITLMTLHSAKGLEFPVVFITGLEEQLFPLARSIEKKEDLEEERRLFYVGLTRSKEKLFLLWAQTRRLYNNFESRLPSRFLNELEQSVLEIMSSSSNRSPAFAREHRKTSRDAVEYDVMPDYESFSQEPETSIWSEGDWIVHDMFGQGQILKMQGRGEKQLFIVRFKDGIQRKLIAKFAKFKRMM